MTDRDALYAAICANPDEDTPRLAFADYLQEQGGKENTFRADYIRAAIRLARAELYSPDWKTAREPWEKLQQKVNQRMMDHKLEWVKHLKGRARAFEFERGFVGHLTVFSKRFVDEGNKFFEQDPIRSVKFVTLTASSGTVPVKTLFACPHLARVSKLALDGSQLKDKDLAVVGSSKHLARLRSLSLSNEQLFTAKGLVKLLQDLPGLSELQVAWSSTFDDKAAEVLAASPTLARLTSLNLSSHYGLSPKGMEALFASKKAAKLRELRLSVGIEYDEEHGYPLDTYRYRARDGAAVAQALPKAKFPNLRFLDLGGCLIGDAGLETIATGGGFPALRQLGLDTNRLTMSGMKRLADSAVGKQLVYLCVYGNVPLDNPKALKEVRTMFPNANVRGFDSRYVPW
jgi:uncharacterized protein (TIGR02996 family)